MAIRLEKDEKMLAEIRRHWFLLMTEVIRVALVGFVPFIVLVVMNFAGIRFMDERVWPLWLFFSAAWWLVLWIFFWKLWTAYYLDVWYVTDRRVIDVEQHWLFSRKVSELRLDKIQDITVEVHGFIAHFLKFGNIHIQTAGQSREIKITVIPDPHRLKEIIWEAHNHAVARINQRPV